MRENIKNLESYRKIWIGLSIIYPVSLLLSIGATKILLILIAFGWIFFHSKIPTSHTRMLFYLIALYLAWTLIAVAFSPFSSNWNIWFRERAIFLSIIPGLVVGSNNDWLRKSLRYVSILLLPITIYAVYQYYFGWDLLRGRQLLPLFDRFLATGLQDLHLTFAGMLGVITPVVAAFNSASLRRAGFVSAFGAISVLSSMARSILLGLLVCGGLFLVFGSRKLRITGAILIFVLVILSSTLFSASGERLKRGLNIAKAPTEQQGDPTRIYLWKSAINILSNHPITGIGDDNWDIAFLKYRIPYEYYSTTAHAHNDFLQAMVDHGIIAGVIFISMWIYIISRTIKSVRHSRGLDRNLRLGILAAFTVMLIGGMFQTYQTDAENALLLWFFIGVSMQLAATTEKG
ncbi:hypothetical protein CEE37_12645 [candidate division LCP-89 bacterium B3_LCP]|uniref:O-antigen ligase-related domain-containing protein n=1 Tax=candidate division LCP-89 bacterium B3_LCP TaxID=2012998 RepID=A0A532UU23_UNCL8|nr:MAG: hypothetical protein CEE37_12645 [candidate division LCP-89 bacterium B3_LCP]